MCYVIAKDRYAHGCIAFETVHGKHLADWEYRCRNYDHQPPRSLWGIRTLSLCADRGGVRCTGISLAVIDSNLCV